jgi:putative alpha-1,2-mannosidase
MAAWYVWATLGLYPQCPGKSGYVHFEPLAKSLPASLLKKLEAAARAHRPA